MPLSGNQLLPRKVVEACFAAGWTNTDNLLKIVATFDAESNFFDHAWQWNSPANGGDGSTDWGICQLNDGNRGGNSPVLDSEGLPRPVSGGVKTLAQLYEFAGIACDPSLAIKYSRGLYLARGFNPWVAYNNGAWKKHIDRASLGICNFLREEHGVPLL